MLTLVSLSLLSDTCRRLNLQMQFSLTGKHLCCRRSATAPMVVRLFASIIPNSYFGQLIQPYEALLGTAMLFVR